MFMRLFLSFSTEYPFFALPVSAVWFLAPVIMYYASKSAPAGVRTIKDEDKKFLMEIARRTWNYFDDFTTPSDNYLAPDNFQEDPPNGLAHRTSPTNIGLHLAAIVCAADLGFIDNFK